MHSAPGFGKSRPGPSSSQLVRAHRCRPALRPVPRDRTALCSAKRPFLPKAPPHWRRPKDFRGSRFTKKKSQKKNRSSMPNILLIPSSATQREIIDAIDHHMKLGDMLTIGGRVLGLTALSTMALSGYSSLTRDRRFFASTSDAGCQRRCA
jgi:hypothetical protein